MSSPASPLLLKAQLYPQQALGFFGNNDDTLRL